MSTSKAVLLVMLMGPESRTPPPPKSSTPIKAFTPGLPDPAVIALEIVMGTMSLLRKTMPAPEATVLPVAARAFATETETRPPFTAMPEESEAPGLR